MRSYQLIWFVSIVGLAVTASLPSDCPVEDPAVVRFRKYIQINTSQSNNLYEAVDFWRNEAEQLGLDFAVYEPAGLPICVLTWPGLNSSLSSIMLNSHMDVVPVEESQWWYPPFAAHVDEDCNLFGRGTQDTKSTAIQYLEAVKILKERGVKLQRTLHITLMPDEETGGQRGIRPFLNTKEFKDLNIGFALDEGVTSENDNLYAMYQDRRAWSLKFTVQGDGGHGVIMPRHVAITKLQRLLNAMMEFRRSLEIAVRSKPVLEYGSFTTMNINMINGGFVPNVIPTSFELVADLRLAPSTNVTDILSMVESWLVSAGNGTKVEYLRQELESRATSVEDTNPFWVALKEAVSDVGFTLTPIVCPATSDMLFVRNYGIPAIGFAPKFHTQSKMHSENEYLNIHTFLHGVDVYVAVIEKVANVLSD